jgi:hypothetical protein
MLRLPNAQGNVRLAILLSPNWKAGGVRTVELKPFSQW